MYNLQFSSSNVQMCTDPQFFSNQPPIPNISQQPHCFENQGEDSRPLWDFPQNRKIKQKLHRTLDIFIFAMQCFILYFPVYVRDVKLKLKKLDGLMSTHSRADLMAVLLTLDPTKCQNNVFTSEETLVWDQTNCVHSIRNTKTEKYPFFSPSILYKIISDSPKFRIKIEKVRSSAMGLICNFVFVKIMMLLQYEVSFISEETVPSYFPPGNDNNSFSSLSKLKISYGNNIFFPVYDLSLSLSLHLTRHIQRC